jgi:hypothetical protein
MVENRFPSMYTYREDVLAGGLISYATPSSPTIRAELREQHISLGLFAL